MGMSRRKPKVNTEHYCRQFFDYIVFEAELAPKRFAEASIDIEICDSSFKAVDCEIFIKEMLALHIELFGLAWWNYMIKLSESDKNLDPGYLPEQIIFTKRYLEQKGKLDIWNIMGFYDEAIMQMVAEQEMMLHNDEKFVMQEYKFDLELLANEFKGFNLDSECMERLFSLKIGHHHWETGILSQKLTLAVMERLGCQLNLKGAFKIQETITRLYNNAMSFITVISEYGSYESYLKVTSELRHRLKEYARTQRIDKEL